MGGGAVDADYPPPQWSSGRLASLSHDEEQEESTISLSPAKGKGPESGSGGDIRGGGGRVLRDYPLSQW